MPVPFYLQRPTDEPKESFLGEPGSAWNTYENKNKYNSSRLVSEASFDKGNKEAALAEHFARGMERIVNAQPAPSRQRSSSWKDSIDYSNGYNSKVEDKFRAEHDYLGLADYLSHFRMGNIQDQRAYETEIAQIRRYGREYNAVHGHATKEQSDAISFLEAFDSGSIDGLDPQNKTKGNYEGALSILGKTEFTNAPIIPSSMMRAPLQTEYGEDEASTISVSFNNKHVSYGLWGFGPDWMSKDKDEHQFNKFAQDTGYGLSDIKAILGENAISNKDGRLVIDIPKSNIRGIKLLTEIRKWCNETGRTVDDVQYASYGPDSRLINDDTVQIGGQIQNISNLLERTNASKDNVMQSIAGQETVNSTTVLPYMNERQMQLNRLRKAGLIDDAKFTSALKADNEVYENLIAATAFSQFQIYTDMNNEFGDENLREMTDNRERGKLKEYIRNAIRENRVKWNAALSNGRYGTYLVVLPEDNKGDFVDEEGDARRGATIWIPGLFTKSAQNAFDSSTQGKTVAEFNSMQQYGYERTLNNGDIVRNVGNNGAEVYNHETGEWSMRTREEAQNMIHQDIIVEDASRNIINRAFDNKGEKRVGYKPEDDAKKIAIAAVNELYPSRPVEELDVEAWNPSKEDAARRKAESDAYKDEKAYQAYVIYTQLMDNIYRLLNINKK